MPVNLRMKSIESSRSWVEKHFQTPGTLLLPDYVTQRSRRCTMPASGIEINQGDPPRRSRLPSFDGGPWHLNAPCRNQHYCDFASLVKYLFRTKGSASRGGRGRRGDAPTRPLTG